MRFIYPLLDFRIETAKFSAKLDSAFLLKFKVTMSFVQPLVAFLPEIHRQLTGIHE